jgi:hypothetical protein
METGRYQAGINQRADRMILPLVDWPVVKPCPQQDARREKLEQYIAGIFHASYGARILECLPLLFSLEREGDFSAALGLRSAAADTLFSEQYLDAPVEAQVQVLYGRQCSRSNIMELGNLVASSPGDSALLYLLVTAAMHEAGVKYLLFTANRAVRISIRRSGFTAKALVTAECDRLGEQCAFWGSYYGGDPQVMLGDIALAMEQARSRPAMRTTLIRYRETVEHLADTISDQVP